MMVLNGLTPEQRAAREGRLTASRVGKLMTGTPEEIFNLWRLLTGDPSYQEPNLDEVWVIQRGRALEPLILDWYQMETGNEVTRRGEVVIHPEYNWAAATLDGWDSVRGVPLEVKSDYSGRKLPESAAHYAPQVLWQMDVCQTNEGVFGAALYGHQPKYINTIRDDAYIAEMWKRAHAFMECVKNLSPPNDFNPISVPVAKSDLIEKDMEGNNAWAAAAYDWSQNKAAAKKFDDSKEKLKACVAKNVGHAYGHGVQIKRSADNKLLISEHKQK